MKRILKIDDLHFQYKGPNGSSVSINSLTIAEGELLALIGSSGAGKTTILRLVSGLLIPDAGSIKLEGVEVTNQDPSRRRIGMVFQRPLLFPFLNVVANVAFALRVNGKSKSQAQKEALLYLDLVGMGEFATREIHMISGGQAQRVALARALAAQPKLLLLDEPFAALDVDIRAEMQDLTLKLRRELKLAMLLVTHDQREAALLADRVALIEQGEIRQQGCISELYGKPNSLQVFRAMGGVNEIAGDVEGGRFISKLGVLNMEVQNPTDGPAVLTFRQESPVVTRTSTPETLLGKVMTIRHVGYRYELGVDINGEFVRVETDYSPRPGIGEDVAIQLNLDQCHLIPADRAIFQELLSNSTN